MEADNIVYDEAQEIFKPVTVTDEMMEYACKKSILVRDMIKRFEKIDVDKKLSKTDPKLWLANLKASNRLERKINREVIKIWKRTETLRAVDHVLASKRKVGKEGLRGVTTEYAIVEGLITDKDIE